MTLGDKLIVLGDRKKRIVITKANMMKEIALKILGALDTKEDCEDMV